MVDMVDDALLLSTLDSLPQQLLIVDADGAVVSVNRAWHDFRVSHGLPHEAPAGLAFASVFAAADGAVDGDQAALVCGIRSVLAGEVRQFAHTFEVVLGGRSLWFESFVVALPAGKSGAVVSLFDVTRERESARNLRVEADQDALTGLPNRRAFEREAQRVLSLAVRRDSPAALVFLDLDDFKVVNDSLGHAAGDDVLVHVGRSLLAETRASDVLARWGGDEFVMLLSDLPRAQYRSTVERFRSALAQPFVRSTPDGDEVHVVRASFGAAFFPEEGRSLPELLSQADEAMYGDKVAGRRFGSRRSGSERDRVRAGSGREGRVPVRRGWVRAKGV